MGVILARLAVQVCEDSTLTVLWVDAPLFSELLLPNGPTHRVQGGNGGVDLALVTGSDIQRLSCAKVGELLCGIERGEGHCPERRKKWCRPGALTLLP